MLLGRSDFPRVRWIHRQAVVFCKEPIVPILWKHDWTPQSAEPRKSPVSTGEGPETGMMGGTGSKSLECMPFEPAVSQNGAPDHGWAFSSYHCCCPISQTHPALLGGGCPWFIPALAACCVPHSHPAKELGFWGSFSFISRCQECPITEIMYSPLAWSFDFFIAGGFHPQRLYY